MLRDRVAVVTGAASGIGRALAERLAARGCHLALVDVNQTGLAETAARLSATAVRVSHHQVDVSRQEEMALLPDEVLQRHGRVDVVVNNAGVALAGPFESYSLQDLEWIMGVNLWGMVYACHYFLPVLRRYPGSHIVNVASDFALVGLPTKSAYCATKFAIRGFSEALRTELHGSGISVICVYPGAVDTQLIRSSRAVDPAKREREAEFVARRALPAGQVAERIVRGIEEGNGRVLIGRDTLAIDLLTRLSPRLTQWLIAKFHKRLSFL